MERRDQTDRGRARRGAAQEILELQRQYDNLCSDARHLDEMGYSIRSVKASVEAEWCLDRIYVLRDEFPELTLADVAACQA